MWCVSYTAVTRSFAPIGRRILRRRKNTLKIGHNESTRIHLDRIFTWNYLIWDYQFYFIVADVYPLPCRLPCFCFSWCLLLGSSMIVTVFLCSSYWQIFFDQNYLPFLGVSIPFQLPSLNSIWLHFAPNGDVWYFL